MLSGRRRIGLASLAALAAALSACGVPVQSRPAALPGDQLPLALSAASTTTTVRGSSNPVSIVQVYMVAGDRLVSRSRLVPSPGTLPEVLGALLAGPTPSEGAAGIRTAINPDTELLSERVFHGRAVIDLSPSFTDTGGPDQILAVAQIVYSVTGVGNSGVGNSGVGNSGVGSSGAGSSGVGSAAGPEINAVSFEIGDNPVEVPTANGTLMAAPVNRSDYQSLLSPSSQGLPGGPL